MVHRAGENKYVKKLLTIQEEGLVETTGLFWLVSREIAPGDMKPLDPKQ